MSNGKIKIKHIDVVMAHFLYWPSSPCESEGIKEISKHSAVAQSV